MPNTTIEQLELQVQSSSTSAEKGIDALSASLSKLKGAIKGGVGLNAVATQLNNINAALNGMSGDSPQKLSKLADSLQKLSNIGNLKISSSISNQIRNIGSAVSSLDGVSFSNIRDLASALAPLSNLGKNNLTSFVTQLKKIPEVVKALDATTISQFTAKIQQLVSALSPLATQLNTISNAFSRLPAQIRQTTTATNALNTANNTASKGYMNLWAKARMAYNVIRGASHLIASCITESNSYIENINLFTASMGKFAEEARSYAETVGEVMGIDPGQFMRYQGVFMTITKGFGVVEDKAYLMSKNLTQLGYDLSSFFNISFEDSMQKLQSGISGELEPLRRLGFDLSVARLQQEAWNLGIEKSVNAMTQAEKSQLRYYAIMTQVTVAQGDMARTLNAPANQLRILSAQVTQCARAFGNIFIPVLNTVLPYLIAFAKVLRMVINLIGKFVGFELPEVDYSGISSGSDAMGDLTDNTNDATNAAKKLKNAMTGIDELNIISPDDGSSGSGSGLGLGAGDLGIELPEYDFLGDAITNKIDELVNKFKEWAGLTDDIDTWAEFFHTKLGRILILIGEIAAGFALWKLSKSFLDGLNWLHTLMSNGLGNTVAITTGIVLTITGLTIEWTGIKSIIEDGIDKLNFGETIGGAILTAIGGTFIGKGAATALAKAGITSAAIEGGMGTALAGALFGGGIAAVVAGLPAFGVGIYSAIKEGLNFLNGFLVEFGATLTGAGAGAIGAALGAWGGPVGIAVGALIGVVVGALTDLGIYLYQNWDDVKVWVGNVGGTIKKFFTETVPGFFKDLPGKIKEGWNKAIQPIKDFDWKQFGYDVGQKVGGAVKKICEAFKKFFTQTLPDVWKKVKESFKTFFTKTLPTFFTETIPEFFKTVKEGFVTFFTETLPEALSDIGEWFVDVGQSIWDGIVEGWNTAIKAVKDFVSGFVQGFKDALGIHSPSTVFRDEVGKFIGDGILEGILGVFKKIGQWVMDNIVTPIQNVVKNNPIKQGIELIKSGWDTVKKWIGEIPTLDQAIQLIKNGWETVKTWIGNIPVLSQAISLIKSGWSTVKNWIGNIPTLDQAIQLIKSGWNTVKTWIGNIPTLDQAIQLIKHGWTTVRNWIGSIPTLDQAIKLIKSGWTTVANWIGSIPVLNQAIKLLKSGWTTVANWIGSIPVLSQGIKLIKSGWSSLSRWIGTASSVGISLWKNGWSSISSFVGTSVSVGISLFKSGWTSIKKFFGLENGGILGANGGVKIFGSGGIISGQRFWNAIPKYANGTTRAHGSLFVAGENGEEMVGHVNGTTEVLNRFQLGQIMYSSIVTGMNQFGGYFGRLNSHLSTCTNAVIRTILTESDVLNANYATQMSYDPSNALSRTVYDDSSAARRSSEGSMYADMRDFYRDFVEPSVNRMVAATEKQADKEEQTIVEIGGRRITEAVEKQQNANGYKFATT